MNIKNALFVGKITPKMLMEEGWSPMVWKDSQLRRIYGWYRYYRPSDFFQVRIEEPRPKSVSASFRISGEDTVEWGDWKKDEEATIAYRKKLSAEVVG